MQIDGSALWAVPEWPRFLGASPLKGKLRVSLEDFQVEELPLVRPSGEGSHLWVLVEKRGANTDWVAQQLAQFAGLSARDVGYAGMKDRHAVTRQWFSIPAPAKGDLPWQDWNIPGANVLEAVRHAKKLQRGVLKGNRFEIVIRDLRGDHAELDRRLRVLRERGLPNYFGPQRFGFGGSNVREAARSLLEGRRVPRAKRSIYLSALRSFLFNHVLAERVRVDTWDQLIDGDVAMLEGTHSVFHCTLPDADLSRRCAEFDLHPTGPLPGEKGMVPERGALELEARVLEPYQQIVEALRSARVEADRRSLRVRPGNLAWEMTADTLRLAFTLPSGAYATTVLDELVSAELASRHVPGLAHPAD